MNVSDEGSDIANPDTVIRNMGSNDICGQRHQQFIGIVAFFGVHMRSFYALYRTYSSI